MKVYVDELPKCCKECRFYALQWCHAVEKEKGTMFISYDKSKDKNNLCPLQTTQSLKHQVREEVLDIIEEKFNCCGYVEEKFEDIKKYVLDQIEQGKQND